MKKIILPLLMIIILSFSSCQSSVEKDALALAELVCESSKLLGKTDVVSTKKLKAIQEKGEVLEAKLKEKYKDDNEKTRTFQLILSNAIEDCLMMGK